MKKLSLASLFFICHFIGSTQEDTSAIVNTEAMIHNIDSIPLRIVDLNPYFTLHVDSLFSYQLTINKDSKNYYWYLRNAPVGLRINRENGIIHFKADKSYFLSGRLRYDVNYKVLLGVQNLHDPNEKIDTSFTIVFFNTEIIPSKLKPSIASNIVLEEGQSINFKIFCEQGSFPIENIMTLVNVPIGKYDLVRNCGDDFSWTAPFDFVKESEREKTITLSFVGSTKFQIRDTATIKLTVKDALNYSVANSEYSQTSRNVNNYVNVLKYTFLQLDKKLKKTKTFRTDFDLTSASTSLTGTILAANNDQKNGKILPSVGLALVPIKEATVPNRPVDQNQAALVRTSIKRLEYMLQDNQLIGERDPDIVRKNNKLKEELKQVQVQLIEVPVEFSTGGFNEEELEREFNSPRIRKKYRLTRK